jgi:hypothetical protein
MEECGPTKSMSTWLFGEVEELASCGASRAYLNLQDFITVPTYSLVVHLVIGIVCITPALIFDKGEATVDQLDA